MTEASSDLLVLQQQRKDRLANSLVSINRAVRKKDYSAIIEHCTDALNLLHYYRSHEEHLGLREHVFTTRMAAYLKSGAFKKALYVLRTQCTAVERRADWCFEEAYALYRLGRFQDCLGLIGSLSEEIQAEKSFQMLLAQTHYRLGSYRTCRDVYLKAFENSMFGTPKIADNDGDSSENKSIDEDRERLITNLLSVQAAMLIAGEEKELLPGVTAAGNNYEQLYNMACCLIGLGDLTKARILLAEARGTGQDILAEEGWDSEAVEAELAPITGQLALVYHLTGDSEAATAMQGHLAVEGIDTLLQRIVKVNSLAIGSGSATRMLKLAEKCLLDDPKGRLAGYQRNALLYNYHLSRYLVNGIVFGGGRKRQTTILSSPVPKPAILSIQAQSHLGLFQRDRNYTLTASIQQAEKDIALKRYSKAAELLEALAAGAISDGRLDGLIAILWDLAGNRHAAAAAIQRTGNMEALEMYLQK